MTNKKETAAFHLLAQMKGSRFKNVLTIVYPLAMKISRVLGKCRKKRYGT